MVHSNLHLPKPLVVSGLGVEFVSVHETFLLEQIGEADSSVQHVQSVIDELKHSNTHD